MSLLRKTFLIVLMLWFPFYTGAAAAMVVCKQALALPGQPAATSHAGGHDTVQQNGAQDPHAQHRDQSDPTPTHDAANDCNQCSLCQVACAPWIGNASTTSFASQPQQFSISYSDSFSSLLAPPSGRPPAS